MESKGCPAVTSQMSCLSLVWFSLPRPSAGVCSLSTETQEGGENLRTELGWSPSPLPEPCPENVSCRGPYPKVHSDPCQGSLHGPCHQPSFSCPHPADPSGSAQNCLSGIAPVSPLFRPCGGTVLQAPPGRGQVLPSHRRRSLGRDLGQASCCDTQPWVLVPK